MARKNPMKALIHRIAWLLCFCAPSAGAAPPDPGIEIPVLPYLSTERLLTLYEPLRQHLQAALHRPVRIVTAPDYRSFVADVAQGDYPLVVNAAHMARLAELDSGYRSLVQPTTPLHAMVIVAADDPIAEVADLRGSTVVTPDPLALISIRGHRLLRQAGLTPGTDVQLLTADTHNNALALLLGDDAIRAAIISNRAYATLRDQVHQAVRILVEDADVGAPSVVYQSGPGHAEDDGAGLTRELLRFANDTSPGRAMMQTLEHGGLREVEEADRQAIDPYIAATREVLSSP
jgi:phosphonate transport system substrate-binding protein